MRNQSRDVSHAERLRLVPPEAECPFCKRPLWIVETRVRHVQTLEKMFRLELKGKKCSSDSCEHRHLRYRPSEEGRLVLKGHEFGLDVVVLAGEQHLRQNVSIPRIHKSLRNERNLPICERTIGNLVDDYLALCECVAGDTDRLRTRLAKQGAVVLGVDGVQFDACSPVLYVLREVLSGEVLYAERHLARGADDLVPMLQRGADLVRDVGVPLLGIVSDKEKGLVPAVARVFPGTPHQFCHLHYLKNAAEPMEQDAQILGEGVREVVQAVRDVQRHLQRDFPALAKPSADPALDSSPTSSPGPQDPAVQAEVRVASSLAQAALAVGSASGRAVLDPPALKRFERLQEVRAAVDQAAQKKGPRRARAGF